MIYAQNFPFPGDDDSVEQQLEHRPAGVPDESDDQLLEDLADGAEPRHPQPEAAMDADDGDLEFDHQENQPLPDDVDIKTTTEGGTIFRRQMLLFSGNHTGWADMTVDVTTGAF